MSRWMRLLSLVAAMAVMAAPGEAPAAGRRFATVQPGRTFAFPRDHGSHPDFKLEWWYVTGHLKDEAGEVTGFQFTQFRASLDEPEVASMGSTWAIRDMYLGHFALSRKDRGFRHDDRLARPGPAYAREDDLDVAIEDWHLWRTGDSPLTLRLKAGSAPGDIDLTLRSPRAPVIHGADGMYRKGPTGQFSSHYLSLTHLEADGTLEVDGKQHRVTGLAWFDHEFFTPEEHSEDVGWDWAGLQLGDGSDLMIYRLRVRNAVSGIGVTKGTGGGTLVTPSGETVRLPYGQVEFEPIATWKSPETGATYPVGQRIRIPAQDLTLELRPLLENQEMTSKRSRKVAYWEGMVSGTGTRGGQPVTAGGYLELTGYTGQGPIPTR